MLVLRSESISRQRRKLRVSFLSKRLRELELLKCVCPFVPRGKVQHGLVVLVVRLGAVFWGRYSRVV